MAAKESVREESHSVGADQLIVLKGGSGKPLLILHEELGYPGWMKWNGALSERRNSADSALSRIRAHAARRLDHERARSR